MQERIFYFWTDISAIALALLVERGLTEPSCTAVGTAAASVFFSAQCNGARVSQNVSKTTEILFLFYVFCIYLETFDCVRTAFINWIN